MKEKINLMYLIQSFSGGGAENLTAILSKELSKNEITPIVCALEGRGSLVKQLNANKIPHFHLNKKPGKKLNVALRLWRFIRNNDIDILHTQNIGPLIYAYFGTRFNKKPVLVHTEHTRLKLEMGKLKSRLYFFYHFILKRLDLFISIALHISEYIKNDFGIRSDKIITIPNGVNLNKFSSSKIKSGKHKFHTSKNTLVLGIIAGLRREKEHFTLIEAIRKVSLVIPEVQLVIVGTGKLDQELREKVDKMDLKNNICFLGYRSDVPEILDALDIFVLTSRYEGLPLCILEAMASGKPVVATDVYGNNEVIKHGLTGVLVPPRDPSLLAKAILELWRDSEKMKEMGRAGRRLVEKKYDLKLMVEAYERTYISLVKKRKQVFKKFTISKTR